MTKILGHVANTCTTLIGVSGMNKSGYLRSLPKESYVYLDVASIFSFDDISLVTAISIELINYLQLNQLIKQKEVEKYNLILQSTIQVQFLLNTLNNLIKLLQVNQLYIVLDHFEKILWNNKNISLEIFKFIRDYNSGKIQYVFSIGDLNAFKLLNRKSIGSLSDLIMQHVSYLKLNEFGQLTSKVENLTQKGYSIADINKITGGYPSFNKALNVLGTLKVDTPFSNEILHVCERLLNSLTYDQVEILKQIANGQLVNFSSELDLLIKLGLVIEMPKKKYGIFSSILEKYLLSTNAQTGKSFLEGLSKNEDLLYSLLLKNIGNLVSKEEIGKVLWDSDFKSKSSDWAIDQAVKRLRDKLALYKSVQKIITLRGRGFILKNSVA